MYLCCMWRYFYIYILIFRNNVARKVKPAMFSCKIITIVIKYNPHVLYKDVKLGYRTMSYFIQKYLGLIDLFFKFL